MRERARAAVPERDRRALAESGRGDFVQAWCCKTCKATIYDENGA
jgi:hypothetical protein